MVCVKKAGAGDRKNGQRLGLSHNIHVPVPISVVVSLGPANDHVKQEYPSCYLDEEILGKREMSESSIVGREEYVGLLDILHCPLFGNIILNTVLQGVA